MRPSIRMRRVRRRENLRRLARETVLTVDDLIVPAFVVPGRNRREEVGSMSGVNRRSVDLLKRWSDGLAVPAVMLFGVINPADKNSEGSAAWREDGPVPSAIEAIRSVRPELVVITDLCLCGYTDHGHCGVLTERGEVDNDETLQLLARMGSVHAAAGADMVAPSAMMDGQVRAIREALDDAGFQDTGIMSYAAKFASSFYGPFRDAARSAPGFGDRRSYQLPPANGDEALRDAELDEAEGADWLMVKPALPYLDVLAGLREITRLPIAAYQVSGEYAMIKAAAEKGAIDEREVVLESLLSMKRAGANAIITYFAESVARWVMRHEA